MFDGTKSNKRNKKKPNSQDPKTNAKLNSYVIFNFSEIRIFLNILTLFNILKIILKFLHLF